jgi:hypothetical protein
MVGSLCCPRRLSFLTPWYSRPGSNSLKLILKDFFWGVERCVSPQSQTNVFDRIAELPIVKHKFRLEVPLMHHVLNHKIQGVGGKFQVNMRHPFIVIQRQGLPGNRLIYQKHQQ